MLKRFHVYFAVKKCFFPIVIRIFFCIILSFPVLKSYSQIFGGNPPVKWYSIDTTHFRLLFTAEVEGKARQTAALLAQLPPVTNSLTFTKPKKINVVLQNRTTLSNGYVGVGPFRSEIHTVSPQNSFRLGLPWLQSVAIHEYRHIQQLNNFNTGIAGIAQKILGDEARSLLNNIAIPDWYWEGDAVLFETLNTFTGRGRIPAFYNNFKAIWSSNNNYSWMKLRNGSLKDITPNHYELGFILMKYGRMNFGDEFWNKVSDDAVNFKGLFYPLQKAIKKHSGVSYKNFRENALAEFETQLMPDQSALTINYVTSVHDNENVKFQHFPQWINDSVIVIAESSFSALPSFKLFNTRNGNSTNIADRYISANTHYSYSSGKIVYAAFRRDARWGWKDYSELVVLDVNSGKQHYLTEKTKYFSPAFSSTGDSIVVVNLNENSNHQLLLLNATDGSILKNISKPEIFEYAYPVFAEEGHIAVIARDIEGKQCIIKISYTSDDIEYLTPWQFNPIGFLQYSNGKILFNQTVAGNDEVLMIENREVYHTKASEAPSFLPTYYPAMNGNVLASSVFTSQGERIMIDTIDIHDLKGVNFQEEKDFSPISIATNNAIAAINLAEVENISIQPYSALTGLFNFHSIRPYTLDPEYSIEVRGENILNSFQSVLSATYNRNEGFIKGSAEFIYAGMYPQLILGGDYTNGRQGSFRNNQVHWNESGLRAGVQLPLNISRGKFVRNIIARQQLHFNTQSFYGKYKDSVGYDNFTYQNFYFGFTNRRQTALQHIYPKMAQSIAMNFRSDIQRNGHYQFLVSSALYFRGIGKNHSLILQGAFHIRDSGVALFSNNFPFSRGYTVANFKKMYRFGAGYHFPLAYPDAGFGNIVYLQRIRAGIFFDYTSAFNERMDISRNFNSTGLEIFFDTKWWNQESFPLGFRISKLLNNDLAGSNSHRLEIILPVLFN